MEKESILFIAYYFPPMGTAGVMRITKFIKYLPQFGYQPTVLTVKSPHFHAFDHSLLDEIPEEAKIIRTESLEPLRIIRIIKDLKKKIRGNKYSPPKMISRGSRWGGILARAIFPPDEKVLWHPFLIPTALSELNRGEYKTIVTTSPPESIHLAGLIIHKLTGIPWIADFRDGWTTTYLRKNQPIPSKWFDRYFEGLVVRNCTRMIVVTDELRNEFKNRYPGVNQDKFITITNGYDPKELIWHPQKKKTNKLVITHCGNFYTFQSASFFLKPLAELVLEKPDLIDKLTINFIGVMQKDDIEFVEQSGLSKIVKMMGYIPHKKALEHQLNSDVLLLISHPDIEKTRIWGKTFEYLWTRRPILALASEGATTNIIRRENSGYIVHPNDCKGIKKSIIELISRKESNDINLTSGNRLNKYSRIELTKKLTSIIGEFTKME